MTAAPKTQIQIADWCAQYLARMLERAPDTIDMDAPFPRIGLDSAMVIYFVTDLEEWLGIELWPEVAFQHPSVSQLSAWLAQPDAARLGG